MPESLCFWIINKTLLSGLTLHWIFQHQYDRVTSQKHLWYVSVFVDWLGFLFSLVCLWNFSPHFLDILQNHITVSAKNIITKLVITITIMYLLHYGYLSKAFTLPKIFLLFLQLIKTWVLFLTDWVRTDNGPVLNSSCSLRASSSGVISLLGFCRVDLIPNKVYQ